MKKAIVYLGIIFLINVSFLFSPGPVTEKSPEDLCIASYIRINQYMGFPVNCDATSFMSASINPSNLFKQGYIRQSRPAYILLGTALGYSIYFITQPFHNWLSKKLNDNFYQARSENEFKKITLYASFYIAYLLINTVILLITFYLFEKIVFDAHHKKFDWNGLYFLMLVLLISNSLCKAFFWTVHQQLFNILTPVMCLYIGLNIRKFKERPGRLFAFSFFSGLLLLFYGNFILLLPVLIFSYLKSIKEKYGTIPIIEVFRSTGIVLSFFFFTILWILLLKMNGILIYNHEVVFYREIIWMTDTLKQSWNSFHIRLFSNTKSFLSTLRVVNIPLLLLLLSMIYKRKDLMAKCAEIKINSDLKNELVIIGLVALEFLVFLWLLGSYFERITIVLSPIILYIIARLLNGQVADRKIKWLLLLSVTGIHLYYVFSYGPFS